jgi:tetratricopeptide (TPR) repeat protein
MRPCSFVFINFLLATGLSSQPSAPEEQDYLTASLSRAIELELKGQIKEAEQILLKVAREAEKSAPGSLHEAVILNNLAVLYIAAERYADAERYFKRAIRIIEEFNGERPPELLARTKLQLASLYTEMGRHKDAMKLDIPPLIDQLQSRDGRMRAKSILAGLAMISKDYKTAELMFQEIVNYWREHSVDSSHQAEIATVLNNMAMIAYHQGRTEVARARIEESLAVWNTVVIGNNPTLAKTLSNFGAICMQAKQYDAAAKWYEKTTSIARNALGESHPFTVAVQFSYAEALKKAGRKPEAEQIKRVATEARRALRDPSVAAYTIDRRDVMSLRDENSR